jgi:ATP/maltotriose-dependent transcriptional regulator MalT/DNA-binding SARP family transcriptional activator
MARLREAAYYRLTVVHAGAGYGKSTALATLVSSLQTEDGEEQPCPPAWFSIDNDDRDPQRFLSHLIAAFQAVCPHLSDAPLVLLQDIAMESVGSLAWAAPTEALVNALSEAITEPAFLVLDDYHLVADSAEVASITTRLLAYCPAGLHIILATRQMPDLSGLSAWRAKGEVLELSRQDLAFSCPEIADLFHNAYKLPLTREEINYLAETTEGWPIALQLVGQRLRQSEKFADLSLLEFTGETREGLFDFLAHDLFDRLPSDLQTFLIDTSVLRTLESRACDAVVGHTDSAEMLSRLQEMDLFIVPLGEGHFRYHHLFHEFLHHRASSDSRRETRAHSTAARFFRAAGDLSEAIYHLLAAGEFSEAAECITAAGRAMLQNGQLDTLASWIDRLPADVVADWPSLQAFLGDLSRLRSRFDEALAWYRQAEWAWRARNDPAGASRALRGQALVYLDTVRPSKAEHLLEHAIRLTDGMDDRASRARLLELLAENKLNMGRPHEAETLRKQARQLRNEGPGEDVLSVRVLLRTGQLDRTRSILEAWAEEEKDRPHPPRSHRETVLILSLVYALQGEAQEAQQRAEEGFTLGERLQSPFITAVAHMRVGHALLLAGDPHDRNRSISHYRAAIALGDQLAVRRTRAEALWGLTRAYALAGDLLSAKSVAAEGMDIAHKAGDIWIGALTQVTLGAAYVLAQQSRSALPDLTEALATFRNCGDRFGRAVARLWLAVAHWQLRQDSAAQQHFKDTLALSREHHYDFLFTRHTLLGPPDPRALVPLLIDARNRGTFRAYANRLLAEMGLADVEVHPGYQLRVQVLGSFRTRRGTQEIDSRAWQREKARHLFQFLLLERGRLLEREVIVDKLWPHLSPPAAIRDFKVALNALNKAIEPDRPPDAPYAFVLREGTAYGIRPHADIWVDAVEFERLATEGLQSATHAPREALAALQAAMQLYSDDYLPEAIYEDWTTTERERLSALYLRAVETLSVILLAQKQYDEVIDACQRILARDRCWERAYRLLMRAYTERGNRAQALRTYRQCVEALRDELAVPPSPETTALFRQISRG